MDMKLVVTNVKNKESEDVFIMEKIRDMYEKVRKVCKDSVSEYGENSSYFKEGATEQEILKWENETGVEIPESYREWLKLTKECEICDNVASFYFPDVEQPSFLPDDFIVIGNVVGDGEVVCFSQESKTFVNYFEGRVTEQHDDFRGVLEEVITSATGKRRLSNESMENLRKLLAERGLL